MIIFPSCPKDIQDLMFFQGFSHLSHIASIVQSAMLAMKILMTIPSFDGRQPLSINCLCAQGYDAGFPGGPPDQRRGYRSRCCFGQDQCQWLDRFWEGQAVRSQRVSSFPYLSDPCCCLAVTSVVPASKILRIVPQAGERIDTGGQGVDLLLDIVGEGVIIAPCLRPVWMKTLLYFFIFCDTLYQADKQ